MPCTAKKFEAQLPKFSVDGKPEVDIVITTSEVQRMINSLGIQLQELEPEAFDMPMGFATGGGVIFGASGGVMKPPPCAMWRKNLTTSRSRKSTSSRFVA